MRSKILKKGEGQIRPKIGGPTGWSPTEEAVEMAAMMIARRYRKHDIYKHIRAKAAKDLKIPAHKCSREVCEIVLKAARKLLAEKLNLDTLEVKSTSLAFYESVIADPTSTITEKLRAQENIDNLLGLGAQFGGKIETIEATADKLRVAVYHMHQVTTGGPPALPEKDD